MKTLVLYESHTGYTRRYAQWISEAFRADILPLKEATSALLRDADLVIFGGSIRGSIISGQDRMKKLAKKAGSKAVLYFGVGLRPDSPRTRSLLRRNNFGSESTVPLFYFQGGLDRDSLVSGDRTMLTIYQAMLKRRRSIHPEDAELLQIMRCSSDYSGKEQIRPLLEKAAQYTKQFES